MDKSLRNQISDLLSQVNSDTVYFFYNSSAFGRAKVKHWQCKHWLNNKLNSTGNNALFFEPISKIDMRIASDLEQSFGMAVSNCFDDYIISSDEWKKDQVVTPLGLVSMGEIFRCLILWHVAVGVDCAIDKLESFSDNGLLKYNEYVVIEGVNISEDCDFGNFKIMSTNKNLSIIPESLTKQLGYPFWIDRALLVVEKEFNTSIQKPEIVSDNEYSKMLKDNPKIHSCYNNYYSEAIGGYYIYERSFNRPKAETVLIDILCFAISLHLKIPASYSWHFSSLDKNHLLYFMREKRPSLKSGSVDSVLGRDDPVSICGDDIAKIKSIYERTVEIHKIGNKESKDFMDCVKLFMDLQTLPMRLDYNKVPMLGTAFEHLLDGYQTEKIRIPALKNFLSSVDQDNKIGEFYEIRGAFVHANQKKLRDIRNNEQDDEIVLQALEDCRKMLKKCLYEKVLPSVNNKQRNL